MLHIAKSDHRYSKFFDGQSKVDQTDNQNEFDPGFVAIDGFHFGPTFAIYRLSRKARNRRNRRIRAMGNE